MANRMDRKVSELPRKTLSLRLSPDIHEAVAKWAADDLRSVNAQIEMLLRRQLKEAGRLPGRTYLEDNRATG